MKLIEIPKNDTRPLREGHTGHSNSEHLSVFHNVLSIFFEMFKYAKATVLVTVPTTRPEIGTNLYFANLFFIFVTTWHFVQIGSRQFPDLLTESPANDKLTSDWSSNRKSDSSS